MSQQVETNRVAQLPPASSARFISDFYCFPGFDITLAYAIVVNQFIKKRQQFITAL